MPRFKALRPILWTENLNASIEFYTEILGFTLQERNDDWQWASLEKNRVGIMLAIPNQHESFKEIGFTGSFYFTVDHVDQLWEKVKTKAKICYGIETFDWEMREFAVYDNNGYILQFGQHIDEISKAE